MALLEVTTPFTSDYGIVLEDTTDSAFDFDTFMSFAHSADMKVSEFPVEESAFATYNKVTHPVKVTIQMAVSGTFERREQFLIDLERYRRSTQLFTVVTPDAVYFSQTIYKFSYSREAKRDGWGRVTAKIELVEVRQVTPEFADLPNAQPGGRGKKDGGKRSSETPSLGDANVPYYFPDDVDVVENVRPSDPFPDRASVIVAWTSDDLTDSERKYVQDQSNKQRDKQRAEGL